MHWTMSSLNTEIQPQQLCAITAWHNVAAQNICECSTYGLMSKSTNISLYKKKSKWKFHHAFKSQRRKQWLWNQGRTSPQHYFRFHGGPVGKHHILSFINSFLKACQPNEFLPEIIWRPEARGKWRKEVVIWITRPQKTQTEEEQEVSLV